MTKPTLTSRVEGLEAKITGIDAKLDLIAGALLGRGAAPVLASPEEYPVPEGGLIEPDPENIGLSLVPEVEEVSTVSALGMRFKEARGGLEPGSGSPVEVEWEPTGNNIPLTTEMMRASSGHSLSDQQIIAAYNRDQIARQRPGPTVEDLVAQKGA